MINIFQPSLGENELNAIDKVFKSNWLGKGKLTKQFEEDFAKFLNVKGSKIRSTNCCSEGLFLSMKLLDLKQNDEVIMPTISFIGAGNAVCENGSKLVLCDVDRRTLNVRASDIEKEITPKTKAIMLIHYGGLPCEMDKIMNLANSKGISVIEDSACSVASSYKGKACGTIGNIGLWSFDAMKILVCGDGSMIYCNDDELANKAEKLLYFGLESKSGFSNSIDEKWWEFDISCYGRRSIMNDITAAMGLEQLKKLPDFIKRRQEIHQSYNEQLKEINWLDLPPECPSYSESSYYFYWIQLKKEGMRDKLAQYLRANEIYTTFRYYPLHLVNHYGIKTKFENAEFAARNTLCIPIHQSLTDNEVGLIADKIKEFGSINNL